MTDLRQRLRSGYLLLDGAMGTQLQAAGLKLGELPELLCFTEPEVVATFTAAILPQAVKSFTPTPSKPTGTSSRVAATPPPK